MLFASRRRTQRAYLVEVGRRRTAGKVEARQTLAQLQIGREAVIQGTPLAKTESLGLALDHLALAAHDQVEHLGGALDDLPLSLTRGIGEGQGGQRQVGFAIHRHGARQGGIGQAEMVPEQAAGRLHLIGDQAIDAQVTQGGRAFAAEQFGVACHVGDHPEHRPGLAAGGTGEQGAQAATRMAGRTYGLEVDPGRKRPVADLRLVQQGDPMTKRDQRLAQH